MSSSSNSTGRKFLHSVVVAWVVNQLNAFLQARYMESSETLLWLSIGASVVTLLLWGIILLDHKVNSGQIDKSGWKYRVHVWLAPFINSAYWVVVIAFLVAGYVTFSTIVNAINEPPLPPVTPPSQSVTTKTPSELMNTITENGGDLALEVVEQIGLLITVTGSVSRKHVAKSDGVTTWLVVVNVEWDETDTYVTKRVRLYMDDHEAQGIHKGDRITAMGVIRNIQEKAMVVMDGRIQR